MKKNMKLNRSLWKTLFVGITAGLFYFAICISGVLYAQDSYLADALYQHPAVQRGDIVLINLDQKSLDALGPFGSWGRALMGDVINILNEDPSSAPAVIALDTLGSRMIRRVMRTWLKPARTVVRWSLPVRVHLVRSW